MAFSVSSYITITITILLVMKCLTVNSIISSTEFDSMVETLRVGGYNLFCNAILTSDLQFDLQDSNLNNSFTFFAPTDSSLFALDMTLTASSYTDTLRFHVIPRRLSLPQLRLLPHGYTLPTLLQHRHVSITRPDGPVIAVNGVHVLFPALFYGRDVAVHGLAGILRLRSDVLDQGSGSSYSSSPSLPPVIPPIRSPDRRNFVPRSSPQSHSPVPTPVPKFVLFNITRRRGSAHSPVASPAPSPFAVRRKAEAPSPANIIAHAPVVSLVPVNISIIHAPEPDTNRRFYPPAYSPAVSPSRFPDSKISSPPVGLKSEALDRKRKCAVSEENTGHMQCYAGTG
ncbi:putative FAS1 domain-containing protein [Lupinus albus]|uniref:Putative FAS1 domain-containing protein n=1 Tax=Lupinus albus TaxID=3870 RepID=A0A6A4P8M1_LUPAL|nr:putative FAS1 domain-containing protein [Lupinus albus]